MGIFDGILICSDLDGTFESQSNYPLPQRNIEAIKYFTKNGGHFTFCTGRLAPHLEERGLSELVNAPACIINGAAIYDFDKACIIRSSVLSQSAAELLNVIKDTLPLVKSIHLAVTDSFVVLEPPFDMNCDIRPNKAVFVFENAQAADEFLKIAGERFEDYYISKSWSVGVEITDKNATKGTAIDFIKQYVGAHTSYGIGDYGNDLPMLQHADVGVAVGNAVDELKEQADITVCDFTQDAIAELIGIIENRL